MVDKPFAAREAGRLTPRGDVSFERHPPGAGLEHVVQQWWIPEWRLPAGEVRDEIVLGYPVCNLVAEHGEIRLHGPTTRASTRSLAGRGWAVGAMLTAAAARHLTETPVRQLVDGDVAIAAPRGADPTSVDGARAALRALLEPVADRLDADDRAATRMTVLVESGSFAHVAELAELMHRSVRSLQRLSMRNTGLPPAALIRRRRLQDAAAQVREDPSAPLGEVAAAHGFADHAHLTREFAAVLGFTPSRYRAGI